MIGSSIISMVSLSNIFLSLDISTCLLLNFKSSNLLRSTITSSILSFAKSPIKPLLIKNDSESKSLMFAPKVFVGLSKSSIFNTLLNWLSFFKKTIELDENKIANKIVNAIIKKKHRVISPLMVYTLFPLRLLPVPIFDWVSNFMGINDAMKNFVGRNKKST